MQENIVKTYVVSKGWRIGAAIGSLIYVPVGFFLFWLPCRGPGPTPTIVTIIVFVLGTLLILFFLFLLVSSFRYRFEVWTDKIRSVGIFGAEEMRLDDVAGYECIRKANGGGVCFVSESTKRKLKIMLMFEDWKEFGQWLEDHFKDLTALKTSQEMESISNDETLGSGVEQRKENLNKIKKWTSLSGLLLGVFAFWGFLHPRPYGLFIWISILLPVFSVGLLVLYPGIFKFGAGSRNPYVPIETFLIPPIIVLASRAFFDWNILNWSPFWIPFAGFTIFMVGLFLVSSKDFRTKKSVMVLWLIYFALFGYGASICLNGILDNNTPVKYPLKVMDKRMIKGRPTEYYMTLPAWGPVPEQREYKVYGNVYQLRAIGDPVTVSLKKGAFNIPYYYIQ